jgi:hypothetical protein
MPGHNDTCGVDEVAVVEWKEVIDIEELVGAIEVAVFVVL